MAASAELRVDQLPADPLLHILSFLSFRDLIKYVTDYCTRQSAAGRKKWP